jgi:membrane protease YdiL (CAAX protease family)
MKQYTLHLLAEFFLLFILMPVSLVFDFPLWIKAVLVLSGFVYIIVVLRKMGVSFRIKKDLNWKSFWKRTFVTFLLIAIITTAYVWYTDTSLLFFVPKNDPNLFAVILLVYSLMSVWPQELIYRTFFINRYEAIFKSKALLVFINAIVFSLAHLFFRNTLVLVLTFIGGLLFGLSYLKFRSTTLVTIEHALYGNWLFTVGMGQMLAFPGMEVSA